MSAPVISTSGAKRRCGWERAIHSRLRRLVEARGAPPRALRRPRIHTLTPGNHGGPLQSGLLRRPRSDTAIVLHVLKEAIGSLNACDGEGRGPHNWCYARQTSSPVILSGPYILIYVFFHWTKPSELGRSHLPTWITAFSREAHSHGGIRPIGSDNTTITTNYLQKHTHAESF